MIPSAPKVPESALLTPSTVHRALCDLVSDVTSSSSVEISVHYIFGLSESSRMRMTSSPSCGGIAADMLWLCKPLDPLMDEL